MFKASNLSLPIPALWRTSVNISTLREALLDLGCNDAARRRANDALEHLQSCPSCRKAMADQLSTISKLRLRERVGRLNQEDIAAVERAICVQLGL